MTPTPAGPMGCHTCKLHLPAFAAGRLDGDTLAAVQDHLSGCERCRRHLAVHVVPALALKASGPTPVPEGLAERAFRAAQAAPAPSFLDRFVPVAARAALAAAVLAVLVWGGVAALGTPNGSTATVSPSDPTEVAVALATEGIGGP